MKVSHSKHFALAFVLTATISAPAMAVENTVQDTGFYLGAKTGKIKVDADGFDDPTSRGLLVGYDFGKVAVEFEYNAADPEYDGAISSSLAGEFDYDTKAIYAAYRSSGNFYFKARGGYLRETLNDNHGSSATENGLSIGGGVGARVSSLAIEAEYTLLGDDTDLLSVSLLINF